MDEELSPEPIREDLMVVVERDADNKPIVWCDPEIVDLVTALNKAGIRTVASCSGHGKVMGCIALKDGRELFIVNSYEEGRALERRERAGGVVQGGAGWLPIETAPEDVLVVVTWKDEEDHEHADRYDFDILNDGCWLHHSDNFEHYIGVGGPALGPGPGENTPYTHWMPLPAAPIVEQGRKP